MPLRASYIFLGLQERHAPDAYQNKAVSNYRSNKSYTSYPISSELVHKFHKLVLDFTYS